MKHVQRLDEDEGRALAELDARDCSALTDLKEQRTKISIRENQIFSFYVSEWIMPN